MSTSASIQPATISPGAALVLLAVCIPVWGVNWTVMKIALESMPPVWLAAARMGTTSLCLFAALAVLGRVRLPGRADLPAILTVGILMMGIYPALTHTGLVHAQAGRASLLSFITPLWVAPAAMVLFGERIGRLKGAGLALGLGGLAVLFNPVGFDWTDREVIWGNAQLLLASMVWAVTILHLRTHVWRLSPVELAPWQLLAATCLLAAIASWTDAGEPVRWSGHLVLLIAYAGPLATSLTVLGGIAIVRALPTVTSSLSFLATPVSGMLASAAILGEPLSATNVGGLVLIVAGLALVAWSETR